jgi:hypothetical protein
VKFVCILLTFGSESSLSSNFLSKDLNVKLHRSGGVTVALPESETWAVFLLEGHSLKVFESGVLWRVFELKCEEVGENYTKRNFIIDTHLKYY